jgi:hypothetical protein
MLYRLRSRLARPKIGGRVVEAFEIAGLPSDPADRVCWLMFVRSWAMRLAGSSEPVFRVARPGAGGVVARPGLFERLRASARVMVVSAPPGSGKTMPASGSRRSGEAPGPAAVPPGDRIGH